METRYLILARYAEFAADGKLNLVGGDTSQYVGEHYPHVVPLIVGAARTVFEQADGENEHDFRAIIVAEDTDEIIAEGVKGTIPKFKFSDNVSKVGTGFVLSFSNVIFPRKGKYIVKLIIDNNVVANAPLRVAPIADFNVMSLSLDPNESVTEGRSDGSANDRSTGQ